MSTGFGQHIAQFRLHFYKADSVIESKSDLNKHQILYSPEEDKIYKHQFFFSDEEDKNEYLLKEIGEYDKDTTDFESDLYYFHTPKDVFFIEFLQEISEYDYSDSVYIEKWFEEMINEGELEFIHYTKRVYEDFKHEIDEWFKQDKKAYRFIFDRFLHLQSHSYTTGYEHVEHECDVMYIEPYKMTPPRKLTDDEMFEIRHGMTRKQFDEMQNREAESYMEFMEEQEDKEKREKEKENA